MPLDRNADPDAMAARIKELEAAQAAAPVSPLVRLWAIAGEVLGMFPKWLLVAALAVFLAFHAFSYYQQAQQQAAQTASANADAIAKNTDVDALSGHTERLKAAIAARSRGEDQNPAPKP